MSTALASGLNHSEARRCPGGIRTTEIRGQSLAFLISALGEPTDLSLRTQERSHWACCSLKNSLSPPAQGPRLQGQGTIWRATDMKETGGTRQRSPAGDQRGYPKGRDTYSQTHGGRVTTNTSSQQGTEGEHRRCGVGMRLHHTPQCLRFRLETKGPVVMMV